MNIDSPILLFSYVALRNIRRDALKTHEKLEKEKKLSEDNVKDLSSDLQKLIDEYMKKVDIIYKQKDRLKVDKIKLIELCGTSESEFSSVSTTMKDLCHDVFGLLKKRKMLEKLSQIEICLICCHVKGSLGMVVICLMMDQKSCTCGSQCTSTMSFKATLCSKSVAL